MKRISCPECGHTAHIEHFPTDGYRRVCPHCDAQVTPDADV